MRRALILGVAGMFAVGLLLSSLAEARVGGGGSSGSRGSRSYSAPRAPATPVTPGSPARPAPPGPSASVPSSPSRGLLGGFGGMLGGFLLGGLLGSLLFGGGGLGLGGGFGLLDLLVVGGLAFLLISFFRRRAPQPAMAGGGAAGPAWMPSGDPPATAGPAVAPAPASTADDEDLARGIAHIQAMDPSFEPASFLAMARDLFTRLQIGWSGGDLAAVRAHLTDEMAVGLEQDLTRLRAQGRANRVEQVQVTAIALTEAWQEYGRDLVTVRITASALDYTVDATTGAVTEGSRTAPVSFTEYWTLARPVGPNPWKVSAIQQPPA